MANNQWAEKMRERSWTEAPGPVRFPKNGLKDGQHRLAASLRRDALTRYRRRRRVAQVATRKYRARKARR